jgi:GNAT superfamily N-acetyltransferase
MHLRLYDGTPASMVAAIEANTSTFYHSTGHAAGADEHADPTIHWIMGTSPVPAHNCVVRANLPPVTADAIIADVRAQLHARGVAGAWHLTPSMGPRDLNTRLQTHGFVYRGDQVAMATDLRHPPAAAALPPDCVIVPVRDDQMLNTWRSTLGQGLGGTDVVLDWVEDIFRRIGYRDTTGWRHYLGYLSGQPVATASLLCAGGVAGIYFVATIPAARRQGIGGGMTHAALQDAYEQDCRVAVLTTSELGYSVYQRFQFQEYCRIGYYEWTPPTA